MPPIPWQKESASVYLSARPDDSFPDGNHLDSGHDFQSGKVPCTTCQHADHSFHLLRVMEDRQLADALGSFLGKNFCGEEGRCVV